MTSSAYRGIVIEAGSHRSGSMSSAFRIQDRLRLAGRDGEAGLGPTEPNRGKAWKPSQVFHLTILLGSMACQSVGSIDHKSAADAGGVPRAADAGAKTADASSTADSTTVSLRPDAWYAPVVDAGAATSLDAGSPGGMPSCLPSVSTLVPRPVEALLVQDRSTAMAELLPSGASRWTTAATGIGTAVAAGTVAWGMMLFPKGGADGNCCQMPTDDGAPEAEVPPNLASAELLAALAETPATGVGRPLARAIVQGANYLSARPTSAAKYLVLVAGGEPTCSSDGLCSGASSADFARTKDAVTHAASLLGIPVAVAAVGLTSNSNSLQPGPIQQLFTDLAKLGGMVNTAPNQPAYYAASSADDLASALAAIVGQMKSCSFALTTPYDWRAEAQVTLSDVRVAQDITHQDGWDFADAGTSVVLYGKACSAARAASSTVSLQLLPACSSPVY